ncbi:DNA internalization-related competence protein ComEC/Rec2 [Halotalea alkalilenta]|nr:DNA internalization-related competence protein ComEC/Rec2 [Halotalea alkalilenta]
MWAWMGAASATLSILAGAALGIGIEDGRWTSLAWSGLLASLLCALVCLPVRLSMMLALFTLALAHGLSAVDRRLPEGLAQQTLSLEGRIVELEWREDGSARLVLVLDSCAPIDSSLPGCARLSRVRLSWFAPPELAVGERWRVSARLRPAHGLANPDAFDYGAWLMRQSIGATGGVRAAPGAVRLAAPRASARAWLERRVSTHIEAPAALRWARGLVLGDASAFGPSDWSLLNDTGTTHLVVVSGMHVGMVSLWALGAARLAARLFTPGSWRQARWPWLLALGVSFCYVALSGFGPPATRAWVMAVAVAWAASGQHAFASFTGWWLALGLLVLFDPLVILRPGLWLSFIAVAALLIGWRWRRRRSGPLALLHTQLTLGVLLDGAALFSFGRLAPLSLPLNLVAIPWVTMVLMPLGLLGTLCALLPSVEPARTIWLLFALAVAAFEGVLALAAGAAPGWEPPAARVLPIAALMVSIGTLWLLPGFSLRWRLVVSIALLPLVLAPLRSPQLPEGAFRLTLYDVGQGQLAEIETRSHRLLYDAGPRTFGGFVALERLWPPGRRFDLAVISHADLDHAGGVAALLDRHRVARWRAPLLESLRLPPTLAATLAFSACRAGEAWRWDGVTFRFLWPPVEEPLSSEENQRSCVLSIEGEGGRVLLLGDIDQRIEHRLLPVLSAPLVAMVSAHHGSASSSARALLVRARPQHVLHSAGYFNAFRHPADAAVRRIDEWAGCQWNTAIDGALRLTVGAGGGRVEAERNPRGVGPECVGVSSSP